MYINYISSDCGVSESDWSVDCISFIPIISAAPPPLDIIKKHFLRHQSYAVGQAKPPQGPKTYDSGRKRRREREEKPIYVSLVAKNVVVEEEGGRAF